MSSPGSLSRLAALSATLIVLSSAATHAQSAPVQVVQTGGGALYLVEGGNAWAMTPNQISDNDVAALTPSGELDGAIPSLFLSASDVLAPLRIEQDSQATLHLVQAGNIWLVPTQISDADLAALSIVGQIGGAISAQDFNAPAPAGANVPQPDVAQAELAPLEGQTIRIISTTPRKGAPQASDSLEKAIRMALDESGNRAAGAAIVYDAYENGIQYESIMNPDPFRVGNAMVFIGSIDTAPAQATCWRG